MELLPLTPSHIQAPVLPQRTLSPHPSPAEARTEASCARAHFHVSLCLIIRLCSCEPSIDSWLIPACCYQRLNLERTLSEYRGKEDV